MSGSICDEPRTYSLRFSKNPCFTAIDPRERGKGYAKECQRLFDWTDVSLTTIQACVLLGAIAITEGNPASENIHYAIACRIAQLLDLPSCATASPLEQEVNNRSSSPPSKVSDRTLTSHSVVGPEHDRCLVFLWGTASAAPHSEAECAITHGRNCILADDTRSDI